MFKNSDCKLEPDTDIGCSGDQLNNFNNQIDFIANMSTYDF